MATKDQIMKLRTETGCSLLMCRQAFEYVEAHPDCTPIGYLYAKNCPVYIRGTFDDRVRSFSRKEPLKTILTNLMEEI